ncbi:hypothetical protein [Oceanobacillus sp. AG]|nr:hypothetical protein [Oceanobacillus sp. AG]
MRRVVEFTRASYGEVLEDFPSAEFIYIVTYNISKPLKHCWMN